MAVARVSQHDIPGVYARIAPVYDWWALLTESKAHRAALDAAHVHDGEAVLEVAVGTGASFAALVRANPSGRNEGLDLTPEMLERAERKVRTLPGTHRLRVGDARALPFGDAEFDLVMNSYMFDLMPESDFAPVLAELWRVLRPGGRLVLVDMAADSSWASRFLAGLYRVSPRLMGGCRGVELGPYVARGGFRSVVTTRLSQLGIPSELVTAVRPH